MFDNDYPNRKDQRRKYFNSRRFDKSCRNHGNCDYCSNGRQYRNKKRELTAKEKLEEVKEY